MIEQKTISLSELSEFKEWVLSEYYALKIKKLSSDDLLWAARKKLEECLKVYQKENNVNHLSFYLSLKDHVSVKAKWMDDFIGEVISYKYNLTEVIKEYFLDQKYSYDLFDEINKSLDFEIYNSDKELLAKNIFPSLDKESFTAKEIDELLSSKELEAFGIKIVSVSDESFCYQVLEKGMLQKRVTHLLAIHLTILHNELEQRDLFSSEYFHTDQINLEDVVSGIIREDPYSNKKVLQGHELKLLLWASKHFPQAIAASFNGYIYYQEDNKIKRKIYQ